MLEETVRPLEPVRPETEIDPDADRRRAWRVAAVILVCNVLVAGAFGIVTRSSGGLVSWIIALTLAYNLNRFRQGTDVITIVLACLSAVVIPLFLFQKGVSAVALLRSVGTLGLTAALLLLLIGRPSRARRLAAIAIYVVVALGVGAMFFAAALAVR